MKPNYLLKTRRQAIARARRQYALKDYQGALAEWDELIERNEDDSLAWLGRFDCLFKLERKEDMLQIGDKVCEYFPDSEAAHNNYACLLLEQNEFEKATRYFDTAIALAPEKTMYYFNAGLAYRGAENLNQAAVCFERVLTGEPEHQRALEFLSQIYLEFGLNDKVIELSMRLRLLRPGYTLPLQRRLYCMMNNPTIDEQEIGTEIALLRPVLARRPEREQKSATIRVAWIVCPYSLRFLQYVMPALKRLKPDSRFRLVGICNQTTIDVEHYAHLFDDVHTLSSASLKAMQHFLSEHPVDVVIDTVGQVPNDLLQLYSKRLAPLQISWPFYHAPMEMVLMDYALVDERIRPPVRSSKSAASKNAINLCDKLVYLETGQFFYDCDENVPLMPSPASCNGYATFGVCADPVRINPESVACWSGILKRLPATKLTFYHHHFPALICRRRLVDLFAEHDVGEDRITFNAVKGTFTARFQPFAEIDILLSPFPVTDDLGLIDALWMGCPVVALEQGVRGRSRAGSVLVSAGQEQYLVQTTEDYLSKALSLAEDIMSLEKNREVLRTEIRQSDIVNVEAKVNQWYASVESLV